MTAGETRIHFSTSLADEGLDAPVLSSLIMAAPTRSARLAEQRTGRVLRNFLDKKDGVIHDLTGEGHYFLSAQAKARERVYRKLGYEIEMRGNDT
jgi:superfamily II DNA or RNA helicase